MQYHDFLIYILQLYLPQLCYCVTSAILSKHFLEAELIEEL